MVADCSVSKEHDRMASSQPHYEADRPSTISALGLRWSALRGMLGSPLIEVDEQKALREELLQELQSVGRSMSEIAARNAVEICAKLDVLSEELRKGAGEDNPAEALLASIRNDVLALLPRGVTERSTVQIVRGAAPLKTTEPAPTEGASRSGEDGNTTTHPRPSNSARS
jgi:hypothetical protein